MKDIRTVNKFDISTMFFSFLLYYLFNYVYCSTVASDSTAWDKVMGLKTTNTVTSPFILDYEIFH